MNAEKLERLRYIITVLASNIGLQDKLTLHYEGNKLIDELAESTPKKFRKG